MAFEFWTEHVVGSGLDATYPYFHWVFPASTWQIGDNTFEEGPATADAQRLLADEQQLGRRSLRRRSRRTARTSRGRLLGNRRRAADRGLRFCVSHEHELSRDIGERLMRAIAAGALYSLAFILTSLRVAQAIQPGGTGPDWTRPGLRVRLVLPE